VEPTESDGGDNGRRPRVARWAYSGAGFFLVGVGFLGIFLPLLPTTVFLLGAAACFARASPTAHRWLTTNRLFGTYLRNYRERRGATPRAKAISIVTLWAGLAASAYLIGPMLAVDVALGLIGLAVTWHLLRLRTIR
jgi:uncharacterized membrane protein YbaN (DUF454 family)